MRLSEVQKLPEPIRRQAITSIGKLPSQTRADLFHDWDNFMARPEQIITPAHGNTLILCGRGWGKTRLAVETLRKYVWEGWSRAPGLVVPNAEHLVKTLWPVMEASWRAKEMPIINRNTYSLTFKNKYGEEVICYTFTGYKPEGIRGQNWDFCYFDELTSFTHPAEAYKNALMALRLGRPQWLCATTPPWNQEMAGSIETLRKMEAAADHRLSGKTSDNFMIPVKTIDEMKAGLDPGSVQYRIEFEGEFVIEADFTVFTERLVNLARRDYSHGFRLDLEEDLKTIVIAVDAAVTASEASDETGIIVAGLDYEDNVHILDDASGRFAEGKWAETVADLYDTYKANYVVAEVNQGGDLIAKTIQEEAPHIWVEEVRATRGKVTRAEPVATLYRKGKVKHTPQVADDSLAKLEEQMLSWTMARRTQPAVDDRIDAMVWAVTDLLIEGENASVGDVLDELENL